jgi:dCTP deaminase
MTLADHQIKFLNIVHPLNEDHLQPASIDLTLGSNCAILANRNGIDMRSDRFYVGRHQPEYEYHKGWAEWTVRPGQLVLFETAETLTLPKNVMGKFEGKSSLGRIGLMTHITAGFIDPGFTGVLTLEMYNCGPMLLVLVPGTRIGQVSFTTLDEPPSRAYGDPTLGSHYQGAQSVQGANFENTQEEAHDTAGDKPGVGRKARSSPGTP